MRRAQQGIALITVLLVMSLALLVTAGMLRSHRLALHSSAQQIHQLQLRKLAFAGEAWALEHLKTQLRDPASSVASGQAWASGQPPLEIDNGLIEVEVEDLAARFNLTALLTKGPADKVLAQRWSRLQALLKLSEVEASALQGLSLSDNLWVAGSCSLLHSPVDLDRETKLDAELKSWLAFAKQKCAEIADRKSVV